MAALWIALGLALLPVSLITAPLSRETQNTTYMFGIRCYVANAVAATDPRYNADGSHSDQFKAMAEKAYSAIWKFGPMIGKSDALIREDIDSYETLYRDTFLRDDAFFQRTRYECGRVGLMQ